MANPNKELVLEQRLKAAEERADIAEEQLKAAKKELELPPCKNILSNEKTLWEHTKLDFDMFNFLLGLFIEWIPAADVHRQFRNVLIVRGRISKLTPEYAMLLAILRLVSGHSQCHLASRFGIDQSNVSRYCTYMNQFFQSLGFSPDELANAISKCKTKKELAKWVKDHTFLFDGSHTRVPTPVDREIRNDYKSGKKKMHTVNTLLMCTKERLIVHVSPTFPGKTHDFSIFKELKLNLGKWSMSLTDPNTPLRQRLYILVDLGFLGIRDIFVGAKIGIKYKKPKGGQLTKEQEIYNKKIDSERATVEHVVGCVKQFKLLFNMFRGDDDQYNDAFKMASTLVNYHVLWDHEHGRPSPRLEELVAAWRVKINRKKQAKLKKMKLSHRIVA